MKRWWLRNRALVLLYLFVAGVTVLMLWNLSDAKSDVAHAIAWADAESCR